ncbi:MAG: tetratricopeptide repeat protein [Actinobacteria bacterium]|nr:tetratricopeptide repeat protein [Actinomycetota bacterium]
MSDDLRPLWDFDDLDATERLFEVRLESEPDEGVRAEILTQLARVAGLRGDFDTGERLLREAEALAAASPRARMRVELERGRLRRSSGNSAAALPFFVKAYEQAIAQDEHFIAADAAHMAALAAEHEDRHRWTERGIEVAESGTEEARYWLGPLLNNLGWDLYETNEYEQALSAFERALAHREETPEDGQAVAIARYAAAKAKQALNRHDEAASQLRLAIEWTVAEGQPDGWFHEALAESSATLGRDDEARDNARIALSLLPEADPSFAGDASRIGRLRKLAEA